MSDLHNRARPTKLKDMHGQSAAVQVLSGWIHNKQIPHAIIFVGGSGTGKTTLARILASHVLPSKAQPTELDCADDRSIDMVRELKHDAQYPPLSGKAKVWILDEVVQLPTTTQQAMLTLLEEPQEWVYLFLCTTRAGKLLDTFMSRCKRVDLNALSVASISAYLSSVCTSMSFKVSDRLISVIAEKASGNMRSTLGLLEKAIAVTGEAAQLAQLESASEDAPQVIKLCRQLMQRDSWQDVAKTLNALTDEHESVRQRVIAYATKALLGGNERAGPVLSAFEFAFTDSGRAGLALACWRLVAKKP